MSEEYNDHDSYLKYNLERKEEQANEGEEGEFIFLGIFSGLFDWLFK